MSVRQILLGLAATLALGACGTLPRLDALAAPDPALELRLAEAEARNDALGREVAELRHAGAPDAPVLPEGVEAGRCYAWIGALDGAATPTLLEPQREALRISPAIYETVEERVLVREARTEYEATPAVVETVFETVQISEGYTERTVIPAVYEEREVETPVREAYVAFEACPTPGDAAALCPREEPARTGRATERVMVRPEQVRELEIPARFMRVRREVVREPARLVTREIPAEYEVLEVQRLVRPAQEETVVLPAVYAQADVAGAPGGAPSGAAGWAEVLCDTPENRSVVRDVQRALGREGHDPGPLDGVFGPRTRAALVGWQREHGLAQGHLTRTSAERLGVEWR